MKSAFSLLVLIATIGLAHAGGFGGPPPFTNGSPLSTGVDGTYQASARGSNLSGVISFTYSGGVQTNGAWVVFYEGQVFFGPDTVAINDGSIAGVLETSFATPVGSVNSTATNNGAGISSSSSTTVVFQTGVSGYFNADLDNNSPTGSFSGNGELAAVAETVKTSTTTDGGVTVTNDSTTTETIKAKFKVKGVRATT